MPVNVFLFRLRVVAYTSNQMVTRYMIQVVYSHPGLLLILQNSHSLINRLGQLLFVGQWHKMPRN